MNSFNISKMKKKAQYAQTPSADISGYQAGAAMNAGQGIVSGTSLVEIMNDANLTNAALNRNVNIINPNGQFVFLGADKSGSGMAIIGVAPASLTIASNKKMTKKAGLLSQIESIKSDAIESLTNTFGREGQHYDVGDRQSLIMGHVEEELRELGLQDDDIDIVRDEIWEKAKDTKIITHDYDENEGPDEDYIQSREERNFERERENPNYKQKTNIMAIKKIAKLKNINEKNLEAFDGDKNTIIVAELNGDRIFKVAKDILKQSDYYDEEYEKHVPKVRKFVEEYRDKIVRFMESKGFTVLNEDVAIIDVSPGEEFISFEWNVYDNVSPGEFNFKKPNIRENDEDLVNKINEMFSTIKNKLEEKKPYDIEGPFEYKILEKGKNGIRIEFLVGKEKIEDLDEPDPLTGGSNPYARNLNKIEKKARTQDDKFDSCVEQVKAKGGSGAKNPYAVCMLSTGKGEKKNKGKGKDKKASINPFVKNR